jgi:hypothetical protein
VGVGANLVGDVNDLLVFDSGAGPQVYALGSFSLGGTGSPTEAVARWNGSAWETTGMGASGTLRATTGAVFNDGTGPAMYVGGNFTTAGGVAACRLARWNGQAWSGVVAECPQFVTIIKTISVAGQTHLYVGGMFNQLGGVAATNIARWNGVSGAWSPLGNVPSNYVPFAIQAFDDGSGPAVFTGGNLPGVLKWVGGLRTQYCPAFTGQDLYALEVFDDGTGPALYAGGFPGTHPAPSSWHGIARLVPQRWTPLHGGVSGTGGPFLTQVSTLCAFNPGDGPSLYVGGSFPFAGNVPANGIARWGCGPCYANCDNSTTPPLLNVNDYLCFQSRFAASDDFANCDRSTQPPTLNVSDFMCFMNKAAAGCP